MINMKKITPVYILIMALCLGACQSNTLNSETRFILDTVAAVSADCDEKTLDGVFSLCKDYENLLSRSIASSDIGRLNSSSGFVSVNKETVEVIERGLYYSDLSKGKFDITVYPLSSLWDFKNQVIPSKKEISEALKSVDYESVEIKGSSVNLNGKKIDLGGIAKGYIADKMKLYLIEKGAEKGIINLGGNVIVFGDEYCVGIKKPFSDDIALELSVKDKSVVTSGIYERYIEKDGTIYHHILDPETGYAVQNSLASVTVIGDSSMDCDALSTLCMLEGIENAAEIIENTADTEAIFIEKSGKISLSSGLKRKNNTIKLK